MKAPLPDVPLFFVHVPKTAGSTVRANLALNHDRVVALEAVEGRDSLDIPALGGGTAVMGHFRYGLGGANGATCNVITLVRDPIERLVSLYRYLRTARSNPLHPQAAACPTFADFYPVLIERGLVRDVQCGMITGLGGQGRRASFDAARACIDDHYVLAAPTEYTDLFLVACAHLLGWRRLDLAPRNVSRAGLAAVPDGLILDIHRQCREDYRLHGWLRDAFLERCATLGDGLGETRARLTAGQTPGRLTGVGNWARRWFARRTGG